MMLLLAGSLWHLIPQQYYLYHTADGSMPKFVLTFFPPFPFPILPHSFFFENRFSQVQPCCLFNFPNNLLTSSWFPGTKAFRRPAAPCREYRCLVAMGGRKSELKLLSWAVPPLSILRVKLFKSFPLSHSSSCSNGGYLGQRAARSTGAH